MSNREFFIERWDAEFPATLRVLKALPMDKLEWMQAQLVKTGNLRQTTDLARLVDADMRAKALALVGK